MIQINILQAKNNLLKLIASLEKNEEDQVIITRDDTPVAVLTLYIPQPQMRKLGIRKGTYVIPDDIDECNDEVLSLMEGI